MQISNKSTKTMVAIHIAVWIIVFLSQFTFLRHGERFDMGRLIPMFSCPIFMFVVFYTEYLYITPKFLLNNQTKKFWILSVLLIIAASIMLHVWLNFAWKTFNPMPMTIPKPKMRPESRYLDLMFIVRNSFSMIIASTIAAMSVLSMKWQSSESARKDAEVAKADAELSNLRNQINPHFLLNTLNNIYALTQFDADKAQKAILELSGLLRHMLYDNQKNYVALTDEIEFLNSYINLMRIRLSSHTTVNCNVDISDNCNIHIAPLIFISIIENAFKHGISNSEPSFINIDIKADEKCIECCIKNSNFPKTSEDKSGHGIGLIQVAKRLELSYPGKYEWEKGTENNDSVYFSRIKIYETHCLR